MRINWGWSIVIAFAVFVTFILAFVYRASQEKIEFVTDNYYEKELKFQEHIDKENNALLLKDNVKINLLQQRQIINIKYPESFNADKISGTITFFKPDNSSFDFNVPVKSDSDHQQEINSFAIKRGWWTVQINWIAEEKPYYYEEKILIN